MELIKDTKNRNLGLKQHKCRVCGAEGLFQSYLCKEHMYGLGEEFEYFVCGECQCMQIGEIPADLGKYYAGGYYSFNFRYDPQKKYEKPVTDMRKILDVGCGSGAWLNMMAGEGYGNLYGCDPFIEDTMHFEDRVTILKCSIQDMEGDGTFQQIRMWDSFEHVEDACDVMENASRLLSDDGFIAISIPIFPNVVFDMFETNWYALEAPRHIYIHSLKSLKYLADKYGLMITDYKYDTSITNIIMSFFYQHGLTYDQVDDDLARQYFSPADGDRLQKICDTANGSNRGDHIEVLFQKKR